MNRKVVIALLACLLIVGCLFWFFDSPSEAQQLAAKKQKIVSSKWASEYVIESKDPRGLGFFNELLKTHLDDSVYILERWAQLDSIPNHDSATYIFVGEGFGMYSNEFDVIDTYVDSGSTIFMAFDLVTENLYERYFEPNAYLWDYSDKFYVALGDTSLAYSAVFQNDTIQADWYPFRPSCIKDSLYRAFAWGMNYPIAFESDQKKGKVIMHSVPRLFCNYQVITPNGFAHASIMLRRIPKDKPVIWMEYGRQSLNQQITSSMDPSAEEGQGAEKQDNSYLQFIMKNEALRWAFLYGILVFLLYVLFRAKRREAVLPGVPEKRNMSLAFVDTLSSIYLSRNSPYSILLVLRKNFYVAINRHFYIDLINTKNREEDINRLIEKASVEGDELRKVLRFVETNKPSEVNQHTLSQLYRYIRHFYLVTGIARPSTQFVSGDQHVVVNRSLLHGGLGILLGLFTLIRGLYSLSMGSGYGILLVILAGIFLYLAGRFISLPVAIIKEREMIVYPSLFGKKIFDISAGLTQSTENGVTTLSAENGDQVMIRHSWLSRSGKHALFLFVEHIKHKSA
ncbi:MAG TPA: hypothetical protein VK151_18625 [Fluviicola sp.]|nr:hypothetical protein [Fluviicola sp.]